KRHACFCQNFVESSLWKAADVEVPVLRITAVYPHVAAVKTDEKVGGGFAVRDANSVARTEAGVAKRCWNIVETSAPPNRTSDATLHRRVRNNRFAENWIAMEAKIVVSHRPWINRKQLETVGLVESGGGRHWDSGPAKPEGN